jgi:hypothetical protein
MIPDPENNVFYIENYLYLRRNAAQILCTTFADKDYEPFSPVSMQEWETRVAQQNQQDNQKGTEKGMVLPVNHWRLTKELMKMRRAQTL